MPLAVLSTSGLASWWGRKVLFLPLSLERSSRTQQRERDGGDGGAREKVCMRTCMCCVVLRVSVGERKREWKRETEKGREINGEGDKEKSKEARWIRDWGMVNAARNEWRLRIWLWPATLKIEKFVYIWSTVQEVEEKNGKWLEITPIFSPTPPIFARLFDSPPPLHQSYFLLTSPSDLSLFTGCLKVHTHTLSHVYTHTHMHLYACGCMHMCQTAIRPLRDGSKQKE